MPDPAGPVPQGRPHQTGRSEGTGPTTEHPRTPRHAPTRERRRRARRLAAGVLLAAGAVLSLAAPALAAAPTSLNGVISNLQTWLVGLLATVATLFLTIAGVRYLTAGGDPGQVERAKVALKSAAIGYALAALAPLIVSVLAGLFG